MLIVCPSCASEYMIDPGRLGAEGRTVRCAGCKSTWFVAADAPADAAGPPDEEAGIWDEPAAAPAGDTALESEPEERDPWKKPPPAGPAVPRKASASRLSALAAPALILIAVAAVAAALWGRAEIVRAVPATAALYAGVGLPVNLRGLEFRGVRSELVAGAERFLVVEGEIANISGRDAPVPPIEIGLRAEEGPMLYTWSNDPPRQRLEAGGTMPFRARLAAPPREARQALVRFVPVREGAATVASQAR